MGRDPSHPLGSPSDGGGGPGARLARAVGRAALRGGRLAHARVSEEVRTAFGRLVVTHAASSAGDALVVVALSGTLFFAVPIDEARTSVALYLLLTMTPYAVVAPLAGPLLDRRPGARRAAIAGSSLLRALLCLWVAARTDTLILYPVAFALLILSRAYAVARVAVVPSLIGPGGGLVQANARLARVALLAGAAAGAPGAALLAVAGSGAVLRVAVVVFLAAAWVGWRLPRPEAAPEEARAGRAAFAHRALVSGARAVAGVRLLAGYLLFLLAFALREEGVPAVGFGFVLGSTALGAFAASVIVPRLRRAGNETWLILAALVGAGGAPLFAAGEFGLDLIAAVAGVAGAAVTTARLAFESLVQRHAPEAVRGRAFARYETLFQLAWVAGAVLPVTLPIGRTPGLIGASILAGVGAGLFAWDRLRPSAEHGRGEPPASRDPR